MGAISSLLVLSWRNIWRNKRRTAITIASIAFAVFFATILGSIQKGAWDNTVDNVVKFFHGYLQVHKEGYSEDRTINKAFPLTEELLQAGSMDGIDGTAPRLESFALASYKQYTKGALVIGTDPTNEDKMTDLKNRLVEGQYFDKSRDEAMIGEGLAKYLNMGVGDTLVLIGQGYHGANAAGKYPIVGLLKFGSPELNKRMVYLPLSTAQYLYSADGLVTSLALIPSSREVAERLEPGLKSKLSEIGYEVEGWQDMIPELVQVRELDTIGAIVITMILYAIIAFGIFGTILMMTAERRYEFGVLVSIGMRRWKLALMVWMEIIFLALIGVLIGFLLSYPVVLYLHHYPITFTGEAAAAFEKFGTEPIMPASLSLSVFVRQVLVVFLVTAVLACYPIININRLKVVEAMRS